MSGGNERVEREKPVDSSGGLPFFSLSLELEMQRIGVFWELF